MAKYSLYPYQEESVKRLLGGKKIMVAPCGAGKLPTSVVWAVRKCAETGKNKVLVVSTPSKALHTQDFQEGFDDFVGEAWRKTHELELTSWHQLHKWVTLHKHNLKDWVIIFDEIQKAKAGVSSRMGRSFLTITGANSDWTGYTGTPGDTWMSFYAYFQACGFVRNKTAFTRRFCVVQTFKGFPEIVKYLETTTLNKWWREISYSPDTSEMEKQLPEATHKVVKFKRPAEYNKVLKLRQRVLADGTFNPNPEYDEIIDNPSALVHYLRQLCFTKEKQLWIKDFVEDLECGCVFFYNFVKTGDMLEEIIQQVLPKGSKVWRIDGSHHDIPTEKTIGKKDMVLCQWQSGSEALDLQFLNYMVVTEAHYSYSLSVQGRGRIRRIGQKKPQFYYYLKTEGTIEDAIYDALRDKKDFSEDVWRTLERI